MPEHSTSTNLVEFFRLSPDIIPPMRADKSAMGSIPAAAHQYCEALRTASGFGWYLFPPTDISLRWDGAEVFLLHHHNDTSAGDRHEQWRPLTSRVMPEMAAAWDAACPPDLKGGTPPYVSALFVPGVVQIWTGLFASTAPGWQMLVRPLANVTASRSISLYEGVVDTSWFNPCPVFINIRLLATHEVIHIPRNKPLFQLQPIPAICFQEAAPDAAGMPDALPAHDGGGVEAKAFWSGVSNTMRSVSAERPADFGRYGVEVRKRAKLGATGVCPHLRTKP